MKTMNSLLLQIGSVLTIVIAVSAGELRAQPGSLDDSFNAVATAGPVPASSFPPGQVGFSVVVQPDGKVIAAGTFGVMRLLDDGSVDPAFQAIPPGPEIYTGAGSGIGAVALQPDGRILVTGNFTNSAGVQLPGIFRLNTDGTVDPSFDLGPGIYPAGRVIALQPDGKIVSSGSYIVSSGPGDGERSGLLRLRSDGSLDPDFDLRDASSSPNLNGLALTPEGKIYSVDSSRVARNNPDGSPDDSFFAELNFPPFGSIAVQPDGKVLVGAYSDGLGFKAVLRLLPDGTEDPGWIAPNVGGGDSVVYSLLLQPDGKILVGGNNLMGFDGSLYEHIGRLHPDGTLDTNFNSRADLRIYSTEDMALAPDGKIFVAALHLDVAAGYLPAPAILRLNNDAGPSGIEFAAPNYVVQEGDGWVSVTVRRTTETSRLAVVSYSVRSGSATPWRDYFGGSGVLVFRPGETQKHIRIYVVRDRKAENYETVRLSLTRARGGNLGPQRQAVLTILNR